MDKAIKSKSPNAPHVDVFAVSQHKDSQSINSYFRGSSPSVQKAQHDRRLNAFDGRGAHISVTSYDTAHKGRKGERPHSLHLVTACLPGLCSTLPFG